MAILGTLLVVLASVVSYAYGLPAPRQTISLDQRPLRLPDLKPNQPCPVSVGRIDALPPQSHIFGIGSFWFGGGPVLFSLAWKDSVDDHAVFSLAPVPREGDAYRAKTPWVSAPSYTGPILIRGHALGIAEKTLEFDATGAGRKRALSLTAPNAPQKNLWSFWPSSMWIPGPGCYGVQMDTLSGTEAVVFQAT